MPDYLNPNPQEWEIQHVPDADIFDKAISLLQWTTQELSSATVSKPKDGTFSLPSAFGSFHSDSLDAALRELESMQRSTSTERLHRLLADGSKEIQAGDISPARRTRSRSSASSRESALSLLSILSNTSSMAEALSVFLDTQYPGTKEIIDLNGLLESADIARLPSIHTRPSELEFLKDLRALEVQPSSAARQHGIQRNHPFSKDARYQKQRDDATPAEESRLTAELLRMLSAEHMHPGSDDPGRGSTVAGPSSSGRAHRQASKEVPGLPVKRQRTHQSSLLKPIAVAPHSRHGESAGSDTDLDVEQDESRPLHLAASKGAAPPRQASEQASRRRNQKRKRARRSEDGDPAWQPEEDVHDRVDAPERSLRAPKEDAAVPATEKRAQEVAAAHIPKSKYKGVSCHKQVYLEGIANRRMRPAEHMPLLLLAASGPIVALQVYLGGFATEDEAARAYDLAAIGCKGPSAEINFRASDYADILTSDLAGLSQGEVVSYVRRRSIAFSRGKSRYRGVSGREGRWETRIGTFAGLKNVSFGVHDEEERAARMYDRAIILEKGRAAKTNFPLHDYDQEIADFDLFAIGRFGSLPAAAQEEESKKVSLPLDEYIAAHLAPAAGARKRKPRPRKVNGIFAMDLQAALLRPG